MESFDKPSAEEQQRQREDKLRHIADELEQLLQRVRDLLDEEE